MDERIHSQDEALLVDTFHDGIAFLREIPMFANLEDVELARLCQIATTRRCPAGTVLLEEGQMNDALCMIRKGIVELYSHAAPDEPFMKLGRGRFFGQVSMFDPAPASASVVARTKVEVMSLREHHLCDLLIAYPEIGVRLLAAIIRDMARRHHTMMKKMRELSPDFVWPHS